MLAVHTNRLGSIAIGILLAGWLVAPAAAQVPDPDQVVVAAPAAPTWDEVSGYDAVEANRLIVSPDERGMLRGTVVSRATDLGSMQEEYLAAAPAFSAAIINQVPADARWAPTMTSWDKGSGYLSVETGRAALSGKEGAALFAPHVSRATDIGSMQEEFFAAPAASSWDESSGYGAVELSRAVSR